MRLGIITPLAVAKVESRWNVGEFKTRSERICDRQHPRLLPPSRLAAIIPSAKALPAAAVPHVRVYRQV